MPDTLAHKEATRERIVDSARRLFDRQGLSEVSIDEIVASAGLTLERLGPSPRRLPYIASPARSCTPASAVALLPRLCLWLRPTPRRPNRRAGESH